MDRFSFAKAFGAGLAVSAGGVALAGTKNVHRALVSNRSLGSTRFNPPPRWICEQLKKQGIEYAIENGVTYYADGRVDGLLGPPKEQPTPEPTGPNNNAPKYTIGYANVTYYPTYLALPNWSQNYIPFYGVYFPSMDGPAVKVPNPDCLSEISAAAVWAWNAVNYVSANGGRFSASIVSAARGAIAAWGGTGMGVSAAAEFLTLLITGCTLGEGLILAGGIGIGLALLYELAKCVGYLH